MSGSVDPSRLSHQVLSQDSNGQPSDQIRQAPERESPRPESAYISTIARDALLKHYGSVKEMAYALGKVDPSQLNREFEEGKWVKRVDRYADVLAKGAITAAMAQMFGGMTTPEARIQHMFKEIRDRLHDVEQYVGQELRRSA